MEIKNKKLLSLIIINSIIFWIIWWILWILNLFVTIFLYSILFYLLRSIFNKIKDKNYDIFSKENFIKYVWYFVQRLLMLILVLIWILTTFSFYNNEISPAKMPIYKLTNWEKEVVFIWMSHIWTKDFYLKVKDTVKNLKKDWYILYFEWVKPWSEENTKKFNHAIWFEFDQNTYKDLSKLYWLVNQNNEDFLWLVNNKDKNVDISIDEIIKLYDWKNNNSKITNSKELINISKNVEVTLNKLNNTQLEIFRYINKSFVNLIIKNENIQNNIQNNFANKNLFDVILHNRNEVLSKEIIQSSDKKIVITYWLLHFNWVFELLKKDNLKWRIEKIDYNYPLK